jgi:hypothetical protein
VFEVEKRLLLADAEVKQIKSSAGGCVSASASRGSSTFTNNGERMGKVLAASEILADSGAIGADPADKDPQEELSDRLLPLFRNETEVVVCSEDSDPLLEGRGVTNG